MTKEICEEFTKKRPFEKWGIDDYTITSPNKKYSLWTWGGFDYFRDYNDSKILLRGINGLEKKRIWNLYKEELAFRSQKALKELNFK